MSRDPRAFLWDVLQACEHVSTFMQDMDEAAYLANLLVQSAVERQLSIVGEALSQLAKLDPALASRVPDLRDIIALRNVLIHGYASLDHRRVWTETRQGLPLLAAAVRQLLADSGPP